MQPALPTLITASLFPPFFFLFVLHPFGLLLFLLLASPSPFVSLSREKWKGLSSVVDPHPRPDARTVPRGALGGAQAPG